MSDRIDFIYRARLEFAAMRPSANGSVLKGIGEEPIEEVMEKLHENDPDGYANLSEFIDLERYRDPRHAGK